MLFVQFRILQTLNQSQPGLAWVVHVAPTRALAVQITRRLRTDFKPIQLHVKQLTTAVELDASEEELLSDRDQPFDILAATPEKLSLVIGNRKVGRPLTLVVMDEARNLEAERGDPRRCALGSRQAALSAVPAMIYDDVRSEDVVLMRMNSAPGSVAEASGSLCPRQTSGGEHRHSAGEARRFLRGVDADAWQEARPECAPLTGAASKRVWEIPSGETS